MVAQMIDEHARHYAIIPSKYNLHTVDLVFFFLGHQDLIKDIQQVIQTLHLLDLLYLNEFIPHNRQECEFVSIPHCYCQMIAVTCGQNITPDTYIYSMYSTLKNSTFHQIYTLHYFRSQPKTLCVCVTARIKHEIQVDLSQLSINLALNLCTVLNFTL